MGSAGPGSAGPGSAGPGSAGPVSAGPGSGAAGVTQGVVGLPSRPAASAHPGALEVALIEAQAARDADTAAVAAGESWPALMHRAAGHLARAVVGFAGRGYGLRVAVVVGKGNNGGDGWAAALRLRREHGAACWVVAVDGLDVEGTAEAVANRAAWLAVGRASAGTSQLEAALAWADVAVDCLLGTGVSGAPRGPARVGADALNLAHAAGTPVVACDIPSGVSADDGSAPDGCVQADLTVTFGAVKRGLLLSPGSERAGRIVLGELGPRTRPGPTRWGALTALGAAPPPFAPGLEKRSRGVVLAVAGAVGTAGAAALTATGALRAGAGLVTAAVPEVVRNEVAARCDAGVMVRALPDRAQDTDGLDRLVAGVDVVTAGPGLGTAPGTGALVAWLRGNAPRLVLDADALNVHRDDPDALTDHVGDLVLTPHLRELARIGGGTDGDEAWRYRVERVPELAERYRATIVAKGPGTIVAAPDGRVWVTPVGSPAAASGGTGDVLAGVIAASIAVADDVPLAVARAVWWHAAAAVRAGSDRAHRATATDLLAALPHVLGDLASEA